MANSRSDSHRLDRVGAIRQTMSSVAEARVREAEAIVRNFELEVERIVGQIRDCKAEITQRPGLTGFDIQRNEQFIAAMLKQRVLVLQKIEKAKLVVAERLQEWIEARREEKIIERVQERRLQEWRRQEDIEQQKAVDDSFIARLVRSRNT